VGGGRRKWRRGPAAAGGRRKRRKGRVTNGPKGKNGHFTCPFHIVREIMDGIAQGHKNLS
jgi:hypothetical protein